MASITGDGREAIERTLSVAPISCSGDSTKDDWFNVFEVQRCIDWIVQNSFQKVSLLFIIYLNHPM